MWFLEAFAAEESTWRRFDSSVSGGARGCAAQGRPCCSSWEKETASREKAAMGTSGSERPGPRWGLFSVRGDEALPRRKPAESSSALREGAGPVPGRPRPPSGSGEGRWAAEPRGERKTARRLCQGCPVRRSVGRHSAQRRSSPLPLAGGTPPLEPAQCGAERSPSALPARGADSAGGRRPAPSGVAAGTGGRAAPPPRPRSDGPGGASAPWPPCTRARTPPPRPRRTSCWRWRTCGRWRRRPPWTRSSSCWPATKVPAPLPGSAPPGPAERRPRPLAPRARARLRPAPAPRLGRSGGGKSRGCPRLAPGGGAVGPRRAPLRGGCWGAPRRLASPQRPPQAALRGGAARPRPHRLPLPPVPAGAGEGPFCVCEGRRLASEEFLRYLLRSLLKSLWAYSCEIGGWSGHPRSEWDERPVGVG